MTAVLMSLAFQNAPKAEGVEETEACKQAKILQRQEVKDAIFQDCLQAGYTSCDSLKKDVLRTSCGALIKKQCESHMKQLEATVALLMVTCI
jgi:hypothetical protein